MPECLGLGCGLRLNSMNCDEEASRTQLQVHWVPYVVIKLYSALVQWHRCPWRLRLPIDDARRLQPGGHQIRYLEN